MENPQQEGTGIVFKKRHDKWAEESEITRQLVMLLHYIMQRFVLWQELPSPCCLDLQ
jgi:hypothetical protein